MGSSAEMVHHISRSKIKPSALMPESLVNNEHCHLTPWGLACLSFHYIQWGLLFSNVTADHQLIDHLKASLSAALCHFYPLAGRLRTDHKDGGFFITVALAEGDGVEFNHAIAKHVMVADVANDEVRPFTRDLFPLNGAVAYDGHYRSLLAVQLTELADGIFLGCSFNHAVGDGTSFMNFLTAWAEICRKAAAGDKESKSQLLASAGIPLQDKWLINDVKLPIKLPFSRPEELIDRFSPPPELRERMFHLSSQSVAQLKLKANNECNTSSKISTFQALCSLIWRAVTRARHLPLEQRTNCRLAADNRPRLHPQLPNEYFSCAVGFLHASTTVGELLGHGLGWGAMLVHQSVMGHTDDVIQGALREWVEAPFIYQPSRYDRCGITIASSPRFDLYGCNFGWGKAVALRSGVASKYDGKVAMYMGREGEGSVDLEINLEAEAMAALKSDEEFMNVVSA